MHGVAILLACALFCAPTQSAAPADDVRLRVSVLDPINRYVADLEKHHFRVYEGKVQQTICYFASRSAPLSLAVILDTTGMTVGDPAPLRKTLAELAQSGSETDELALITLESQGARVEMFSTGNPAVETQRLLGKVLGLSRLDEGLYLGLNHVRTRNTEKRAVVLIGNPDGIDLLTAIKPFQEYVVQLYAIRRMPMADLIVELTGGRTYNVTHPSELDYYLGLIHSELRHQYILGYRRPQTAAGNDGKVSVQLDPPKGAPRMNLRVWKPNPKQEDTRPKPRRSSHVLP